MIKTTIIPTKKVILEKEEPELRDIIGSLAVALEFDVREVFVWFEEDNTGDIDISISDWSCKVMSDAISYIHEEFLEEDPDGNNPNAESCGFNYEDTRKIDDLVDLMVRINVENKENKIECSILEYISYN